MSLKMSVEERNAFLVDLHVGIIAIERAGQAPLAVPIWYDYDPEVGVWVLTEENSQKGRALREAGRFSICAQIETPPAYQYVSVEGPIVDVRKADREKDARPMAIRYLGKELGDRYTDSPDEGGTNLVFTMRPETWRTVDYAKLGGDGV
jgi:nitroimidazol reductase NimA-like FMN-containing flavoprotein (pyridoxamine 5'-phosphate oxidase superfamily)